jgi:hypothetical protein
MRLSNKFNDIHAQLGNRFYTIGEFGFRKHDRYLIDGFLPESGLVLLAGDPKAGKTAIASAIALAVAKGKPFAGMETKQGAVLWMCLEESYDERCAVMRGVRGITDLPFFVTQDHIPVDTEDGYEEILEWVVATKARLLVVDPLHAAHSGRSLHDGWAARKTLKLLKRLSEHCTVLVLHHLSRTGTRRIAESVQLSAIATMLIHLVSSPPGRGPVPEAKRKWTEVREINANADAPETGPSSTANSATRPGRSQGLQQISRLIILECLGRGDFANRTWQFVSKGPLNYEPYIPEASVEIPGNKVLTGLPARIVNYLSANPPKSAADIAAALNINLAYARNLITRLRKRGLLTAKTLARTTFYKPKYIRQRGDIF